MSIPRPCPTCAAPVVTATGSDGLCPACLLAQAIAPLDADTRDEHDTTVEPGTIVGPFRIVRLIGRGGMAAVYEAHEAALNRSVALKVLPREFLHDRTFAERFQQEARVVAALEHPNIVPIYATGIDGGAPWMSMRLLPGGALGSALAAQLSVETAIRVLRGVAAALDYAHERGVIHRDIKPSNILLDEGGHVCVVDFGIARLLEAGPAITTTGHIVGTPQYMSPEQALGAPLDHRSDLYSLGVVAYEMFTGVLPFDGPSLIGILTKHVNEPVPLPHGSKVGEATGRVLLKALEKDPAKRWPTAAAFVDALEASLCAPAPVPRWRGTTITAAAASVTIAGVLSVIQMMPSAQPPSTITLTVVRTPSPRAIAPLVSAVAMSPPDITVSGTTPTTTPAFAATTKKDPERRSMPTSPLASPDNSNRDIVTGAPIATPGTASRSDVTVKPTSAPKEEAQPSATSPAQLVPPAEVFTPPVISRSVETPYPQLALAAQLEGDVLLEADVDETGHVTAVNVVRSVHPVLDEAARRSVLQYTYTPGLRNGHPVVATIRVTVSFRLKQVDQ